MKNISDFSLAGRVAHCGLGRHHPARKSNFMKLMLPFSASLRAPRSQLLVALWLLSTFNLQLSTFAQGSLTPPGAPAQTFKTLQQVEPRTAISSAPFTVSSPDWMDSCPATARGVLA